MVFALEPKFVFPGEGVVGVEDTFAVTAGGLEQLTRFSDDLNENTREV
jgi:Xaa-Pro aminopeptidase